VLGTELVHYWHVRGSVLFALPVCDKRQFVVALLMLLCGKRQADCGVGFLEGG
jgi:hypothetical protein